MASFINISFSIAGKSTLLQILAGKRLITSEGAQVSVKGCDVFRRSPPGVTYLGTEWRVALSTGRHVRPYLNLNATGR